MQRRMIDEDSWLCQNTEMYSNGHSINSVSKLSDCDLSTWRISFGPSGVHLAYCEEFIIASYRNGAYYRRGYTIVHFFYWQKWTWMSAWVRSVCILNRIKEPLKFYALELSNALMNNDAKLQAEYHSYDSVH